MKKTLRNLALIAILAAPAVNVNAEIAGSGTAADPYIIATAEDLCAAHKKTLGLEQPTMVYFVQTADIDMAGVDEYNGVNGSDGVTYSNAINYDGRNHVIKNFAPTKAASAYYSQTIFGVASGVIKNLGVIDVNVKVAANQLGSGVLGGYAGHSACASVAPITTIENVYITGKYDASDNGNYSGGFFGTNASAVQIKNCFANLEFIGSAGYNGGVIGRLENPLTLTTSYVAGTVKAGGALVADARPNKKSEITFEDFIVFTTGSDVVNTANVTVIGGTPSIATAANKAELIDEVKLWPAFSDTEEIEGLPALRYALSGEGTAKNPYIIDSAEALCNAYRYVNTASNTEYFFIQTADIDMVNIEDYHAINGYDGDYAASINYDGKNHVIKNFTPNDPTYEIGNAAGTKYYYCTSIFGVATGTIKNLGVENAFIMSKQGVGILGAYVGHHSATQCTENNIDNVFVSGVVTGDYYGGGMFGTTDTAPVNITNSYANVKVEGTAANRQFAPIVGRVNAPVALENVYTAGTVTVPEGAAALAGLVCGSGSSVADPFNVIAFNTGVAEGDGTSTPITQAFGTAVESEEGYTVATAETKDQLIEDIMAWKGFNATEVSEPITEDGEVVIEGGYPILAWQKGVEPGAGEGPGTPDDPQPEKTYYTAKVSSFINRSISDGWDGTAPDWASEDAIKSKPCPRYGTALNGKFYTVDMMTMSIAEVDQQGNFTSKYKLPSLEGVKVEGVDDYYGCAISHDDAGNFIVGHYFTKPQSMYVVSIYSPKQGKTKRFVLENDDLTYGRIDNFGRAIGDVTKEGYLYIAPKATAVFDEQRVNVISFTGNGDVESVEATSTASKGLYMAGSGNTGTMCQPAYEKVEEMAGIPAQNAFYWYSKDPAGGVAQWSVDLFRYNADGSMSINYAENWNNYSKLNGFDTFTLEGKRFFVVSYADEVAFNDKGGSNQTIIIKDEEGKIYGTFNNEEYKSDYGYMTITADKISDETVMLYVYNCTINFNEEGAGNGAIAGMVVRFSTIEEDPTGIFDAEIIDNGAVEYFNLQGVRVANPENGIYIVRRGNQVAKELVR